MRFPRKKAVRAPRATQLEEPLMGCLTVVWLGPPSRWHLRQAVRPPKGSPQRQPCQDLWSRFVAHGPDDSTQSQNCSSLSSLRQRSGDPKAAIGLFGSRHRFKAGMFVFQLINCLIYQSHGSGEVTHYLEASQEWKGCLRAHELAPLVVWVGDGEACSGKAKSPPSPATTHRDLQASQPKYALAQRLTSTPGALGCPRWMHTPDNSSWEIFAHTSSCFINESNLYGFSSENKQHKLILI